MAIRNRKADGLGDDGGSPAASLTAWNICDRGQVNASDALDIILLGASCTGIGAATAGVYYVSDFAVKLTTGSSTGERLDDAMGHPLYDF
jgi:hypothetical protein